MTFRLIVGDCIRVMPEDLEPASVDAIVTDPPYGLEFMGKAWDAFRLDDPGTSRNRGERAGVHGMAEEGDGSHPSRDGVAVAFGGGKRPSTYRCTGCGRRDQFRNLHGCDARWARELIDPYAAPPTMLALGNWTRTWALEALRVLKPGGHLLSFGGTRTFHRMTCGLEDAGFEIRDCLAWLYGSGFPKSMSVGDGWGTGLKPAFEPIVLARRPIGERNIAENVERYGTGALNIDATRLPLGDERVLEHFADPANRRGIVGQAHGWTQLTAEQMHERQAAAVQRQADLGRWPPNLTLDEAAAAMLDEQAGVRPAGGHPERRGDEAAAKSYGGYAGGTNERIGVQNTTGGASRFFYVAKADREERERAQRAEVEAPANVHPTVKPVELMQWLVKLVTPAGGVVLDPFAGSGSTGMAALREGFDFVGIEQEPEYVAIARARIVGDGPLFAVEVSE